MWQAYYTPSSLQDALGLLAEHRQRARAIAGGTDLLLEIERGARSPEALVDLTHIPDLGHIRLDEGGHIHLGPLVTHNQVVASALCRERALPLTLACWGVGAPQIRNRGTVAGNLATASPANDTIPPLQALGASVALLSLRGRRVLPIAELFHGPRRTAIEPDELIVDVSFPAMAPGQCGTFLKAGLRRAQAIAVASVAVVLTRAADQVADVRIALGSVASTVVRAAEAERALAGAALTPKTIAMAGELAAGAARPIDDVRGSAAYRRYLVATLTRQALRSLAAGTERGALPAAPVMLWGKTDGHLPPPAVPPRDAPGDAPITVTLNGETRTISGASGKTLLRMLREDAGLTGTKEGCAEGECGACTVLLDGIAVMSCLTPAPQADGRRVTTVEGLAQRTEAGDERLHPLQRAFVEQGAVQCGYCSPGMLMSGAALLDECEHPGRAEITQAIAGNLCRCTGYYAVIRALEEAACR